MPPEASFVYLVYLRSMTRSFHCYYCIQGLAKPVDAIGSKWPQ